MACPEDEPQQANCDPGYLPCEDDITKCCEVVCDENYHTCGEDSTECCLDTTSHSFMWTIDTLGSWGSYLNDVTIIDENDIWVVGKIIMPDSSSGTGYKTFNTAHWNGVSWEIIQIDRPVTFDGVFAESTNDIWFIDGCFIYHYNGSDFEKIWECDWQTYGPRQVNKIVQTQSGDIYTIGNNGFIYRYNGTNFVQMTNSTSIDLKDIGYDDNNLFVSGYSNSGDFAGESVLLQLVDNQWETIIETDHFFPNGPDDIGLISAVWVNSDTCYIMSYSGIKKYSVIDQNISHWVSLNQMYASDRHILKFMGPNRNDLIFADGWGYFIYFNGSTWEKIDEIYDMFDHGYVDFNRMQCKDNIIVAIGELRNTQKALIIFGNLY